VIGYPAADTCASGAQQALIQARSRFSAASPPTSRWRTARRFQVSAPRRTATPAVLLNDNGEVTARSPAATASGDADSGFNFVVASNTLMVVRQRARATSRVRSTGLPRGARPLAGQYWPAIMVQDLRRSSRTTRDGRPSMRSRSRSLPAGCRAETQTARPASRRTRHEQRCGRSQYDAASEERSLGAPPPTRWDARRLAAARSWN
jgi:hypothetical protein